MTRIPTVLVLVPFRPHHLAALQEAAAGRARIVQVWPAPEDELLAELLADAEIVIGEPAPAVLASADTVRWVQMTWAGTDLYTRGTTPFPAGCTLTNVAGSAYGHIISQYVVGQVLALAQNLPAYVRQQEREIWHDVGAVKTLEGCQVLIFGAGDLGLRTAERLSSFGVHSTGVCRSTEAPRPPFERLATLAEAEALLPEADVVVNCLPNTDETAGYLDARRLALLKPDSILVNVGRGNFIDCNALAEMLAEGAIRGAALDVTDPEPLPAGHALWREPRCVITPHAAGGGFGKSLATEDRICAVAAENLARYLGGEPLTHVVIEG